MGVASHDHVLKGVNGGFAQLCHGKETPLKKMNIGDWLIYYSAKQSFKENKPYQKFTAIGKVIDENIYRFDMENGFLPFRRNLKFIDCEEAPIRPLIPNLSFIKNKKWGYPSRYGHLEINDADFILISKQMNINGG